MQKAHISFINPFATAVRSAGMSLLSETSRQKCTYYTWIVFGVWNYVLCVNNVALIRFWKKRYFSLKQDNY